MDSIIINIDSLDKVNSIIGSLLKIDDYRVFLEYKSNILEITSYLINLRKYIEIDGNSVYINSIDDVEYIIDRLKVSLSYF